MQIVLDLDLRCMDCGKPVPVSAEGAKYENGVYRVEVAACISCYPDEEKTS